MICNQRESALADATEEAVRERIRTELASGGDTRSIRRTHCEVVASIDPRTRTMITIGGNVLQAVTARKLNLRKRSLKFQAAQKGHCGGADHCAPDQGSAQAAAQAGQMLAQRQEMVRTPAGPMSSVDWPGHGFLP